MSTFKVGQRVKKVRGKEGVGSTGTVIGFDDCVDPAFPMLVRCDGAWKARSGRIHPASKPARCIPEQWEPLTPSGAAPSELTYTELMDRCRAGEGLAA